MKKMLFLMGCFMAGLGIMYPVKSMELSDIEESEEVDELLLENTPCADDEVEQARRANAQKIIQIIVNKKLAGLDFQEQQAYLKEQIENKATEFIRAILSYDSSLGYKWDKYGKTPLHWALLARCDASTIALILASHGKSYNAYESVHTIFKVVDQQREDVLDVVLAAGAHINRSLEGKMVLSFAFYILDHVGDEKKSTAQRIIIKLVCALLEGKNNSPSGGSVGNILMPFRTRILAIIATQMDDAELISKLLAFTTSAGFFIGDLNSPDDRGNTILHYAVSHKRPGILNLLLADPRLAIDATNSFGRTAIMMAAADHNIPFIKALIARGADATITDGEGKDAYAYAASDPQTLITLCYLTYRPGASNQAAGSSSLGFAL